MKHSIMNSHLQKEISYKFYKHMEMQNLAKVFLWKKIHSSLSYAYTMPRHQRMLSFRNADLYVIPSSLRYSHF